MESKTVNTRFPIDLYNRIKKAAEDKGLNVCAFIKMAITDYLNRNNL